MGIDLEEDLKRKLIDLNLSAGRSAQSPQTGYVHLHYESEERHDTIPILENFCFSLALFRSRIADNVLEGKALLEKLLVFEADGNFPVYLHEYPQCKDRDFSLSLLPIFHWLIADFRIALGGHLAQSLEILVGRILSHGYKMHAQRPLCGASEFRLKSYFEPGTQLSWTPSSPEEWADALISCQIAGSEQFLIQALEKWHPQLCTYIGPQYQNREEPKVTLFDLFMGRYYGIYSQRALRDRNAHLLASLIKPMDEKSIPSEKETPCHSIYPFHLKVGEFANAEGGRFASEPAQVTIGKLEPGRVGCEDAPSAKAKLQLSGGRGIDPQSYSLCWGTPEKLNTFFLDAKLAECILERKGNTIEFTLTLPPKNLEGQEAVELAFFMNLTPSQQILIQGAKATTFQLGDTIELLSDDLCIHLEMHLEQGQGQFFGHILRANRPTQKGKNLKWGTYDWQIALRTIRRSEACVLKGRIQILSDDSV